MSKAMHVDLVLIVTLKRFEEVIHYSRGWSRGYNKTHLIAIMYNMEVQITNSNISP